MFTFKRHCSQHPFLHPQARENRCRASCRTRPCRGNSPPALSVVHVVHVLIQKVKGDVVEAPLHEPGVAYVVGQGELEMYSSNICVSTQINIYKDCQLLVITSCECSLLLHLLNQCEDLLSLPVHEGVLLGPLKGVQVTVVYLVFDGVVLR